MRAMAAAAVFACLLAPACEHSGQPRAHAAAATAPPGYRIYVSDEDSHEVSVVDPNAHRVIASIPVGRRPRGMRLAPDGRMLFVALSGSPKGGPGAAAAAEAAVDRSADGIGAVDLASGRVARTFPSGNDPESFDLTPDGRALYVSNEDSAATSRLDLHSATISHVIEVGAEPEGVAVRPDGLAVYVTSEQTDTVAVIDARTQSRIATLRVGRRPRAVVFSPDGARAYVSNELGASVSVIDARAHRVLAEVPIPADGASSLGVKPMGLCLAPSADRLFVSNGRGGTISVIDLRRARVVQTIREVGTRPWGIATSPDGETLYAADGPSNELVVIDIAAGRVTARIAVGRSPWGVVVGPAIAPQAGSSLAAEPQRASTEDDEWRMAAKDYQNTRFSRLRQIDTSNVARLQPAWSYPTGNQRGHEAAPLVIGDRMYLVTPFPNELLAFDLAKPGAHVAWVYRPAPDPAAQGVACCDVVNRGAAYAADKIFFNTLDMHTIAVDAKSGRELWKTRLGEISRGESMTMAPLVVGTRVLVGNSGGEFGVRGWLSALDRETGALLWRAYSTGPDADVRIGADFEPFYPQDRGPDLGVHSWPPGRWQTGGGTVWGFISYDPELDLIYYGTGNPGPWNPQQRPGANRWTAGMFARRPDSGAARWFYQWNPHDLFDYDGVNESVLVDLVLDGAPRKVLLHPDRNGYLYVLDRVRGQVLSATPFAAITTSQGVDLRTGKLNAVASKEPRLGQVVRGICPASPGAKDWQPSAYSPDTGLLYIPHNNLCQDVEGTEANYIEGTPYLGANVRMYAGPGGHRGAFTAWNPIEKRAAWSLRESFPVWSGALATAGGLVFYGTMDGWFKALDARSGELLWSFKVGSGIIGQPITYRAPDGKQYVAIAAGVGGWAGATVSAQVDTRDQSAALGFANAMRDLPAHTKAGGTLHVFGVP
jgi:lanthanide-dependent methanol dehydrogenase